jgi:hypothetical protein
MEAKELRIGNIVDAIRYRDDSGDFYPTVVKSLSDGWGVLDGKNVYSTNINHEFYESGSEWGFTIGNESECKPIPLTEEWIIKFGFDIDGGMGFKSPHNTSHWHFSIRNGFIPSIWASSVILSDGYKGCKYVHQLQNLYFALTNEELIIKQ